MALRYKTRKRLAVLILLVGVPLYVAAAVTLVNWADARWGRLPIWAEVAVYLVLGFLWALPFRGIFRGIGQPDPDSTKEDAEGQGPSA